MVSFSSILLLLSTLSHPQIPSQSSCGDCHVANPDAPEASHLQDWEFSAHGRNQVGCEACHGGNATTFEPFRAHQGVLNSSNPASPVNWQNVPETCGGCHIGPFVAFQKSAHFKLLKDGNESSPNCTTCHGEVAAQLLSPSGLAKRCESCHGDPGGTSYHPDYPAQGKLLLDLVKETRTLLSQAPPLISRIADASRRARFEEAYRQAEVPLIEAVNTGHAFSFAELEERLAVAVGRTEALLKELANP
ncbi:MAG: cytochrome c3 family protein [Vicinamibacteria bacterium]